MIKWYIQDSTNFGSLERNVGVFVDALKELNNPYKCVGVIPFSREITGLDETDQLDNCMFYGSTQLVEKISQDKVFTPGVFFEREWFDPRNWAGNRPDMLNSFNRQITVKELRDTWVAEDTFVKSVREKMLNGMVLEATKEDKDIWMIEHSELDGDELLVMSEPFNIEREWRFFIVDGKLVSGSLYKWFKVLRSNEPIPTSVWNRVEEMIKLWMPSKNIVMDVGELRDGSLKVIEYNCINCSGLYKNDAKKIIEAINNVFL